MAQAAIPNRGTGRERSVGGDLGAIHWLELLNPCDDQFLILVGVTGRHGQELFPRRSPSRVLSIDISSRCGCDSRRTMHRPSSEYQTRRTKNGYRLVQHGVVLSEMRSSPGATDSVFDVLAALVAAIRPDGRLGLLGFASGSVVAPLRYLGVQRELETCDLDQVAFQLFHQHCGAWAGAIAWSKADANQWLQQRPGKFDLLIDDLSVPVDDDVFKPECSWSTLPQLMKSKLKTDGVVVANQLKPADRSWATCLRVFERSFGHVQIVHLDDFENRIVLAGDMLPTVRDCGRMVRDGLRQMKSRQADRVQFKTWC